MVLLLQFCTKRWQSSGISLLLLLLLTPLSGFAQQQFAGQWYSVNPDWHFPEPPTNAITAPSLTGGHFVYQAVFEIIHPDETIVIDFKNASALAEVSPEIL